MTYLGAAGVLDHLILALLAYNFALMWSNRRRRRFERFLATYAGHERRLLSKYGFSLATIQQYALLVGTLLFGLGNGLWWSASGAGLFALGMILEPIAVKIPKDRPATAAPANRDPLTEVFRSTVRDALSHQRNENIMAVIVIEPDRGDRPAPSDTRREIMLVKGTALSFFPEKEDIDFIEHLRGYLSDPNLVVLYPLILKADADQNGGSDILDTIISNYFIPPHQVKGMTVYGAVTAGAARVRSFDVIARTPAQEVMITNLINERIRVLSTGQGFGEAFGKPSVTRRIREEEEGDDDGMTLRSHGIVGFAIFLALVAAWRWLLGPSTMHVLATWSLNTLAQLHLAGSHPLNWAYGAILAPGGLTGRNPEQRSSHLTETAA